MTPTQLRSDGAMTHLRQIAHTKVRENAHVSMRVYEALLHVHRALLRVCTLLANYAYTKVRENAHISRRVYRTVWRACRAILRVCRGALHAYRDLRNVYCSECCMYVYMIYMYVYIRNV